MVTSLYRLRSILAELIENLPLRCISIMFLTDEYILLESPQEMLLC